MSYIKCANFLRSLLFFLDILFVSDHLAHLFESHPRLDGQHNLLFFGRVGVILVLLQPGLQGVCALPGGRLGPRWVSIRVLAVQVDTLSGVDMQRGWVGPRVVLQLVLGVLECHYEGREDNF